MVGQPISSSVLMRWSKAAGQRRENMTGSLQLGPLLAVRQLHQLWLVYMRVGCKSQQCESRLTPAQAHCWRTVGQSETCLPLRSKVCLVLGHMCGQQQHISEATSHNLTWRV